MLEERTSDAETSAETPYRPPAKRVRALMAVVREAISGRYLPKDLEQRARSDLEELERRLGR